MAELIEKDPQVAAIIDKKIETHAQTDDDTDHDKNNEEIEHWTADAPRRTL